MLKNTNYLLDIQIIKLNFFSQSGYNCCLASSSLHCQYHVLCKITGKTSKNLVCKVQQFDKSHLSKVIKLLGKEMSFSDFTSCVQEGK